MWLDCLALTGCSGQGKHIALFWLQMARRWGRRHTHIRLDVHICSSHLSLHCNLFLNWHMPGKGKRQSKRKAWQMQQRKAVGVLWSLWHISWQGYKKEEGYYGPFVFLCSCTLSNVINLATDFVVVFSNIGRYCCEAVWLFGEATCDYWWSS